MKKNYIKPTMVVHQLASQSHLLAGSTTTYSVSNSSYEEGEGLEDL